ncbi:MAG: hypothetical protein HY835_12135 [Anaerolineae bacterium]|nr:hypothetical protein [Anaerolineae bacterium]
MSALAAECKVINALFPCNKRVMARKQSWTSGGTLFEGIDNGFSMQVLFLSGEATNE